LNHSFQVLEYDAPEELLLNEGSAFSRMVQSTGPTNAQYLRSLVLGGKENKSSREETKQLDGQRRWLASSRWAAATQFALGVSLTSLEDDLQIPHMEDKNNILKKTKDAVITLQGVLEGRHDRIIDEALNEYQVPADKWWSALYKIVEGTVIIPPQHTLHLGI
jgi:ATP-binding cassette subfamily C (CFTR/MRP) protein 1